MSRSSKSRLGGLVIACAGLTVALGGCGGPAGKAVVAEDAPQFNSIVANSQQPVLMMFYKQGCASCAALEPTIDKLAGEYDGRAVVAKYMVFTFVFTEPSPEIKEKYDIGLVPTVILFDKGQEKHRWVADYEIDHYRKALNEVVGPAPKK